MTSLFLLPFRACCSKPFTFFFSCAKCLDAPCVHTLLRFGWMFATTQMPCRIKNVEHPSFGLHDTPLVQSVRIFMQPHFVMSKGTDGFLPHNPRWMQCQRQRTHVIPLSLFEDPFFQSVWKLHAPLTLLNLVRDYGVIFDLHVASKVLAHGP